MEHHIVAGEELKKKMTGLSFPVPFNEDMSVGSFSCAPFEDGFIQERSQVHRVSEESYRATMGEFLALLNAIASDDTIHLYFGEDKTCLANRALLISFFTPKVAHIILHHMDEYAGTEQSVETIK